MVSVEIDWNDRCVLNIDSCEPLTSQPVGGIWSPVSSEELNAVKMIKSPTVGQTNSVTEEIRKGAEGSCILASLYGWLSLGHDGPRALQMDVASLNILGCDDGSFFQRINLKTSLENLNPLTAIWWEIQKHQHFQHICWVNHSQPPLCLLLLNKWCSQISPGSEQWGRLQ